MITKHNIGIDMIDKIYHIADIHVRNVKRHKEYRSVFQRLYHFIKKDKTENSVIYVAGDIVHAKTDMSPELIDLVQDFFKSLADLAPTIVIIGNHDCNLNNSYRLDALTPIMTALQHNNLFYFKESGLHEMGGVVFNHMSVIDVPKDYIRAKSFKANYKIALHHGAVNNATTDLGIRLNNDQVTTDLFTGHDLSLLGDIHKAQFLDDEKTIAYPGSLIQQSHGEKLIHGILIWDLKSHTSKFQPIKNDYGYYTFEIENGKIINPSPDIPKMPRLRFKIKDTDSGTLKEILTKVKQRYNVQEVTLQKVNQLNEGRVDSKKLNLAKIRDVEFQNILISEQLDHKFGLDDKMLDVVRFLNRKVNSKLPETKLTRNVTWVPKRFEFSNMFSYGEGNVIDFTNIHGCYGIFAPNHAGKSAILDALSFCCFDKCSRSNKAVHVLNNKKQSFQSKFEFELDGRSYVIERSGKKHKNGHVKVLVNFYYFDDDNEISLNGDQRDSTNKAIRQYLGSYDDFILTALSLQNNNTGFIDKSQRERKDLLSQFLDIDIFESLYQIANEDIKETATLIRQLKREDFSTLLATALTDIRDVSGSLKTAVKEKGDHSTMKDSLNEIVVQLTTELKPIDTDVQDIATLKSNLEKMTDLIVHRKDDHKSYMSQINILDKTIFDLESELETMPIKKWERSMIVREDCYDKIRDLTGELKLKKIKIQHAEKMVSKLEKHEWDPDCKYCIANPWLQDTQSAANLLPKLQLEYDAIMLEQATLTKKAEEYNWQKYIDAYYQLESTIQDNKDNQSRHQECKNANKDKIDKLTQKMELVKDAIDKFNKQKDAIEFNKIKTKDINEHKFEITTISDEISVLDTTIIQLSGKLEVARKIQSDAQENIDTLKELESQYEAYGYYLQAVQRDGVPYNLITKALPLIEAEINNILTQIVDFTVVLHTDGKNINAYIVYDDQNFWPLELTSGMEKFIASLAIRTSLINVSNLPRPNFLAIDEGFGVLDSEHLSSMYMLFDYLKSQFDFVWCISHIDTMRDIVDNIIDIDRVNGYSKIHVS